MGVYSPASLVISVMASISSSPSDGLFFSSSDEPSLLSNRAGVAAWARILRVIPPLETAREPRDMELSEHELCPDPLAPWHVPGSTTFFTGDPSARLRRAFSLSIMGDIWVGKPRRDKSKGGTETGVSQKCGGVFNPATSAPMSGAVLDCELGAWLDWEPDTRGSKMDLASNSSSKVSRLSASSSFGVL